MASYVIFGGSGFVGQHLSKFLLNKDPDCKIFIADIRQTSFQHEKLKFFQLDVRNPVSGELLNKKPDWIFNFAAIHREPGHSANEYFETNLKGAENICRYAEEVDCKNIYFTSSISVYGPVDKPTDESALPQPITPYGGSKYPAELIHQGWFQKEKGRRLIISRPGVIYGPGDPGNILRMINAIKKGYFFFPGNRNIHKSYAYIYGLLNSIWFTLNCNESLIIYNYVEYPTETIDELAKHIKKFFNLNSPIFSLPTSVLVPVAQFLTIALGNKNPIHPVRVVKAGRPTHIVPQTLLDMGFNFSFDFYSSLDHWNSKAPEDFK
jgi:nucleoside-diphosphate-sugar epimerase